MSPQKRVSRAILLAVALAGASCSDRLGAEQGPDTRPLDAVSTADTDADDTETLAPPNDIAPDSELDADSPPKDAPRADLPDTDIAEECTTDSDADGLTDCREERLCTDPHDGDTDGDHLGDGEEILEHHSDPCRVDTDADGVSDDEEIRHGLDPRRPSSYADGRLDADRWFLSACDEPRAKPHDFRTNLDGNWTIALPRDFTRYTNLSIATASGYEAAALFQSTGQPIAGFLLSYDTPSGSSSPVGALEHSIHQRIDGPSHIDLRTNPHPFTTHDGKSAATVSYELRVYYTSQLPSPGDTARSLLFTLADFNRSDVRNIPAAPGTGARMWRLKLTVIERHHPGGGQSNLVVGAVAPRDAWRKSGRIRSMLTDATNTTNIAAARMGHRTACQLDRPPTDRPETDFYWVVDHSGSMYDERPLLRQIAPTFAAQVANTRLDYRFGVTNAALGNNGRLQTPPAWHTTPRTFDRQMKRAAIDCQHTSSWYCIGEETGLESAYNGLAYMNDERPELPDSEELLRPSADVFTIFVTDEEPQGDIRGVDRFFQNHPRFHAFALYSKTGGDRCYSGWTERQFGYNKIARANGGEVLDLCTDDLALPLGRIANRAALRSADFPLRQQPISSSLRVYLDGRWVPRSRQNGFAYSSRRNALTFFGDYRPEPTTSTKPVRIAVLYETWQNPCKRLAEGADTCRRPAR